MKISLKELKALIKEIVAEIDMKVDSQTMQAGKVASKAIEQGKAGTDGAPPSEVVNFLRRPL